MRIRGIRGGGCGCFQVPHPEFATRPLSQLSFVAESHPPAPHHPNVPATIMTNTTEDLTYAVTHEIDFYGGTSRRRVLSLTDDLDEARDEVQALNDAACAPYDAWPLGHNETGNRHIVYEVVRYIDYGDWATLPGDLFDAVCAIRGS